jgi:hypothetical protein
MGGTATQVAAAPGQKSMLLEGGASLSADGLSLPAYGVAILGAS